MRQDCIDRGELEGLSSDERVRLRDAESVVLDSTILEDAVATQDAITQLVAAIRRVRRLLPGARRVEVAAHDYEQPGTSWWAACWTEITIDIGWECASVRLGPAGAGVVVTQIVTHLGIC